MTEELNTSAPEGQTGAKDLAVGSAAGVGAESAVGRISTIPPFPVHAVADPALVRLQVARVVSDMQLLVARSAPRSALATTSPDARRETAPAPAALDLRPVAQAVAQMRAVIAAVSPISVAFPLPNSGREVVAKLTQAHRQSAVEAAPQAPAAALVAAVDAASAVRAVARAMATLRAAGVVAARNDTSLQANHTTPSVPEPPQAPYVAPPPALDPAAELSAALKGVIAYIPPPPPRPIAQISDEPALPSRAVRVGVARAYRPTPSLTAAPAVAAAASPVVPSERPQPAAAGTPAAASAAATLAATLATVPQPTIATSAPTLGPPAQPIPLPTVPSPGLARRALRGLRHGVLIGLRLALVVGLMAGSYWTFTLLAYGRMNPPASTLMLGHYVTGRPVEQQWVGLERVSPNVIRAVIASEDGGFCRHLGVDWGAIEEAFEKATEDGGRMRGASTISMQTVKNIMLWPQPHVLRKVLELPLAYLAEISWGKRRMLELYLNIAEWGPGIFGIEAAAQYHFRKSAASLNAREAALLAVALPNPIERSASAPGPGTLRLAQVIERRAARPTLALGCLGPLKP